MRRFLFSVLVLFVAYYVRRVYRGPSIVTSRDQLLTAYDYIVVGAGTAGSVVAARLSELPNVTVLVLEDGWESTEVVEGQWPRGKGLGGSSTLGGATHGPGGRLDPDAWDMQAGPGWTPGDLAPYLEKIQSGPDVELSPLAEAVVEAAKSLRHDPEGQGYLAYGPPLSTTDSHLRPAALQRPDQLHVLTGSRVTRLLIDESNPDYLPLVTGVEYVHNGVTSRVTAAREVILSAGASSSPQLLMFSGVGPKADLDQNDIRVLYQNSAVGRNLKDQLCVPIGATVNESTGSTGDWLKTLVGQIQYLVLGTGPLSTPKIELSGLLRSGLSNQSSSDLQWYLLRTSVSSGDLTEEAPDRHRISLLTCLLRSPVSGEVRLQSGDPTDHPMIDYKYLESDHDIDILVQGLKEALHLLQSSQMKKYDLQLSSRPAPGCEDSELWSDEYLRCYAKSMVVSKHHRLGTCRMGIEGQNSVVDTSLRVHGVDHVRVVDASVLPLHIPQGPRASTLVVAEKASDLIKHDFFNPPAPEPLVLEQPPPQPQPPEELLVVDEEDEEEEGQCYHPEDEEEEEGEDEEEEGGEDTVSDKEGPKEDPDASQ